MTGKQNAPRDQREAAGRVKHWQSAITVHDFTPKTTWRYLAALCEKAATLGECDSNVDRREKWNRLASYLAQRIARSILREVGRR